MSVPETGAEAASSVRSERTDPAEVVPGFRGTIVALGGGGFSMSETGASAIDDELLRMATVNGRRGLPKGCFVPTASGDSKDYISRFLTAFESRADTSVLTLFGHDPWGYQDPRVLLEQDIIYVGGGSTVNLLTLWRKHGLPEILRRAAANGTILAGISAGANCWFEASSTDSFGPLAPLSEGLGFLPGSLCPHYRGEAARRELFAQWIAAGRLPEGIAIDEFAAVVFDDGRATRVISEAPGAMAFVVSTASERELVL